MVTPSYLASRFALEKITPQYMQASDEEGCLGRRHRGQSRAALSSFKPGAVLFGLRIWDDIDDVPFANESFG